MNYEFFIAKRLSQKIGHKGSVSNLTVKIASLSVALSILIMLVAISVGVGIQKEIRQKVSGIFGHLQIKAYEVEKSHMVTPVDKRQKFYPNIDGFEIKDLKHIQVYANKAGVIKTKDSFEGVILKGVGEDYHWQYFKEYMIEGKIPKYNSGRYNDSVMVSKKLTNSLKLKLSDKFNMYFFRKNKPPKIRSFVISGIFDTAFEDFDKNFIIGDLKHVQRLNKWKDYQVGGFEVFIDDFDALDPIAGEIYRNIDSELDVVTMKDTHGFLMSWIGLFDMNIMIIITIMVLVSGVNMITVLIVLILERTEMIGIFKALGMYNRNIRKIFLYNSLQIMLRGLFWGNIIGLSLLSMQKYFKWIQLPPKTYYVSTLPIAIDLVHILMINIGVVVFCLVMMLLPSYIISKIKPIKAIKFN